MEREFCGDAVERLNYNAWGRRRNPQTLSYDNVTASFDRGYTLHEHYDDFGLINMNGRLYDPLVGRMLSPDIVIQDEQNSQAYNRYSYCFNNPLRYTDPNGENGNEPQGNSSGNHGNPGGSVEVQSLGKGVFVENAIIDMNYNWGFHIFHTYWMNLLLH